MVQTSPEAELHPVSVKRISNQRLFEMYLSNEKIRRKDKTTAE